MVTESEARSSQEGAGEEEESQGATGTEASEAPTASTETDEELEGDDAEFAEILNDQEMDDAELAEILNELENGEDSDEDKAEATLFAACVSAIEHPDLFNAHSFQQIVVGTECEDVWKSAEQFVRDMADEEDDEDLFEDDGEDEELSDEE